MLYNNLSGYFRDKYGERLAKICIDGGFTCPNRDGTCGVGGCIFCGERGSGEHINSTGITIRQQINDYFEKKNTINKSIAYFQNFTNTYAPVKELKRKYDEAVENENIVALAIGTRPDCITDEVAELISTYKEKYEVWVELGLQTANDETAKIINRGYLRESFERAVKILNSYNIPVVVHIIVGLPNESMEDIKKTVALINKHKIWGIKIHSLYVMRGTKLEEMYLANNYKPITMNEYVDSVVYILTHISPSVIIHRLTGDCPKGLLVAPDWNTQKNAVIQNIVSVMERNNYYQGVFYERK